MSDATESTPPIDAAMRHTVERALSRTLFVEAGAGTGKTTELVERIVNLVIGESGTGRVRLSKIAAITFTEAAAAELRDRVRSKFEARLHEARRGGNRDQERLCIEALEDADLAAISTLHAFAQRLLSERSIEVGVPPRVDVVDEVQSQLAFEDRWSQFVDELYADDDVAEFIIRASILGVSVGTKSPLRTVAKIFDDNWDRLPAAAPTPRPKRIDWDHLREAAFAVDQLTVECTDDGDLLLDRIRTIRPLLQLFLEEHPDIDRLRALDRLSDIKVGRTGKAPNWNDVGAARDTVTALSEQARSARDSVADDTLQLLAGRVAEFTLSTADHRRREGQLEFHDLLVLARQLLRTSAEARSDLSSRYEVLMLDEFQDTDPIQIELALLLAGSVDGNAAGEFEKTWEHLDAAPGRLFMVGDPKQSIYRFRRADIGLFLKVRDKFSDGHVTLSQNFRTVAPIIDMVNALFAELMPEDNAAQAKYSPLVAARAAHVEHRPLVLGGPMDGTAAELREAEAADVADAIGEIAARPGDWPVFDTKTKTWGPPKMSDITVLLPTRTSLSSLTRALDDRGIPYRADTGSLVYETQEVRDLLAVLRAVDDPTDQISLVAALRSPLYACGDDDLYRWHQGGGQFDLHAPVPPELEGSAVADAVEHLRTLAADRWWLEPSELLLRVIDERAAMALGAAGTRPRDVWRRIRYIVDQARAFAESGGGDLRAYLNWTSLQGLDGSKAHEPMLPEIDDDAVRIMTIHGSKGLEFPITIVSGLTTQIKPGTRGVTVRWGGPGEAPSVKLKESLKTEAFDARQDLEEQMDRPEKDRLLYVAMTRARDHLVISGFHGCKTNAKGELKPTNCHGRVVHDFATGSGEALVRLFSRSEGITTEQGALALDRPAPPQPVDEAAWRNDRAAVLAKASTTSVVSATAVARHFRDLAFGEDAFEDTEEGLDDSEDALPPQTLRRGRAGSAIGRAVHAVLQFVDLTDPQPDVIAELATSQAWFEAVPEHVDTIRDAAHAALEAPIVHACRSARHWKELYVAAPVGTMTFEGYVDLLVETPEGLVIVDYKTDAVRSDSEIEQKLAGYARQGAAYACALAESTGLAIADVQFVFAQASGAVVRSVPNLAELQTEITRWAGDPVAGS